MIFDRTALDVDAAVKIRDEKVKSHQELTEEDIDILEKGFITLNTINRIEENQSELKSLLNNMGYYGNEIVNKKWQEQDYFLKSDLERIVKNNNTLKNSYYVFSSTPVDAIPIARFEEFNKIEKMLYDLETMVNDMTSRFKRCGTFNCGGAM